MVFTPSLNPSQELSLLTSTSSSYLVNRVFFFINNHTASFLYQLRNKRIMYLSMITCHFDHILTCWVCLWFNYIAHACTEYTFLWLLDVIHRFSSIYIPTFSWAVIVLIITIFVVIFFRFVHDISRWFKSLCLIYFLIFMHRSSDLFVYIT